MGGTENGSWRLYSQEQDSGHIADLLWQRLCHTLGHRSLFYHSLVGIYAILLHFCHIPPLSPENGGCGSCCLMLLPSESKFHAVYLIWEALVTCLHSSCRRDSECDSGFCLWEAALILWCILQTWVCSQKWDYSKLLSYWYTVGWLGSWSSLWIGEPFIAPFSSPSCPAFYLHLNFFPYHISKLILVSVLILG